MRILRNATRGRRRGLGGALVLLGALGTGCAAPSRTDVPAELPLRTNDQLFAFQWALERQPDRVRAVGLVRPSFDAEARLTVALYGVDAAGRITSRGIAYVQSAFGSRPTPFSITLTPTGQETRFELRVLEYHVFGLQMS
jgi:hypothetical protein